MKKLEVEFESNINNRSIRDRKYTLTHSDETGQRYLFVGELYAEDRYSKLRDEVVGEWAEAHSGWVLNIMCTLYSEFSSLTIKERYEKFKQHMPRAIKAIVNGDREYLVSNDHLEHPIYVSFLSDLTPGKECYGKINDYI